MLNQKYSFPTQPCSWILFQVSSLPFTFWFFFVAKLQYILGNMFGLLPAILSPWTWPWSGWFDELLGSSVDEPWVSWNIRGCRDQNFWGVYYQLFNIILPWKSKTKQRMVFWMIHGKDSPLPMGKVWSLDFLGIGTEMSLFNDLYETNQYIIRKCKKCFEYGSCLLGSSSLLQRGIPIAMDTLYPAFGFAILLMILYFLPWDLFHHLRNHYLVNLFQKWWLSKWWIMFFSDDNPVLI